MKKILILLMIIPALLFGQTNPTNFGAYTHPLPNFTPNPPTTLSVVAGYRQFVLTWDASVDLFGDFDTDVSYYDIYRSTSSGSYTTKLNSSPITNLTYTDTPVSDGVTYYYVVKAIDSIGQVSIASNEDSDTTVADSTNPSQVTGLSATAVGTQINLSWNVATDTGGSGLVGYRVERSTPTNSSFSLLTSPTTNSHSDVGLAGSTTYYYRVKAVDGVGNVSTLYSSEAFATTATVITTPAITSVSGTATTGQTMTISGSGFGTSSTSPAFVRLGNNTTYASSTYTITQTTTSWADGSITFTVNQGTFGQNGQAYVYVSNSSGNINTTGYPITTNPTGPVISNVSGTISHNQPITITGSAFGSKVRQTPLKWDTFDHPNAVSGDHLNTIQPEWVVFANSDLGGALYSNTRTHSGTLSAYTSTQRPDMVNWNDGEWNTNWFRTPLSNTIFISYWIRTERTPGSSATMKHCRITSSVEAGGGGVYNGAGEMNMGGSITCDEQQFQISDDDGISGASNPSGGTIPYPLPSNGNYYLSNGGCDTWYRADMGRTLNTPGVSNGWVMAGYVGYEVQSYDNIQNIFHTGPFDGKKLQLNTVLLGFDMPNYPAGANITTWIDDIYIDDTRARVEIGNSSTFNGSTHREMQPYFLWTDGTISINFNKGSFVSGNTVYLYVINANGTVSNASQPLTIQ